MSGWRWLVFNPNLGDGTHIRSHAIPPKLYDAVMDDLLKRHNVGDNLIDLERSKRRFYHDYCIDFGGIVQVREHKHTIRLSGPRVLSVRDQHGPMLLEKIEKRLRQQDDWRPSKHGPWVRLKGYWHLCVVTVAELEIVRQALRVIPDLREAAEDWEFRKNAMVDGSPYLTRPGKAWPMAKGELT
jgi:hypothetical protein